MFNVNICTSGRFLFGEVICADRCASSRCRLSSVIVEQVFIRLITIRRTLERAVQSLKKEVWLVNLQSLRDVRLEVFFFFRGAFPKFPKTKCSDQEG